MTAFGTHLGFEFRAGLRNATALLMFYLFPLGFYVLMGIVMVELNPAFADVMIPALVVVTVMAGTVLGLPSQLVEARDAGIYRSFKVNRVPATSILLVPILAAALHTAAASTVIGLTGEPVFGGRAPVDWWAFFGVTLLTIFVFGGIAALIAVVSSSTQATVMWSQLVFLPSMLIGGLMVDLAALPTSVLPAAKLLPSTYAVQAMLGSAWQAETILDVDLSVVVLLVTGGLALALARLLFEWDPQNQTRRISVWWAATVLLPLASAALIA